MVASNLTLKLDKEISSILKKSGANKSLVVTKNKITYADFLSDKMLMISVIKEGVPYSLFN